MKKIFDKLRKEIILFDKERETLILQSRPIVKQSKQAIYALHRNDLEKAKKMLDSVKQNIAKLKPNTSVGAFNAALQEYTEAITYYYYIKNNKLVDNEKINVDPENYLLGICDLTGELSRRAVLSVVNEKYSEVKKIKDFVESIHDEFLKFELRNSELRKKSDAIKWNLKKIDEILYDLKIRGKI